MFNGLIDPEIPQEDDVTERPLDLIDVNWNHPCCTVPFMAALVDASERKLVNLLNGETGAIVGTVPTYKTPDALGGSMGMAGTTGISFSAPPNYQATVTMVTLAAIFQQDTASSFKFMMSTSTVHRGWALGTNSTGTVLEMIKNGVVELSATTISILTGVPYFVAFSSDEGRNIVNIVLRRLDNGALTTNTGIGSGTALSSTGGVVFGCDDESTLGWTGSVAAGFIINDYFPLTMLVDWAENPWGFFEYPLEKVMGMQSVIAGGGATFKPAWAAARSRALGHGAMSR